MCTNCAPIGSAVTESGNGEAEVFTQKMLQTLNGAATALMISVGHRTGLFDAMGDGEPRTSDELANHAKLHERYVREWLAAMTTSGIVHHESGEQTYRLPSVHASMLTRAAAPNCMASPMQWFAVLGGVEDRIVHAFRAGGGVPYEAFNRFHDVMAEESDQTSVMGLDEHIVPLIDGLRERLERGIDVIDVGCGRGRAMLYLAKRYPNSRFNGIDFSDDAIGYANAEAARRGLPNVRFAARDAAEWSEPNRYDWITTFDAVHDQARPDRVLANIWDALRPGGVYLMQDISASSHVHENLAHPMGTFLYTISTMHCMTVSLAAGGMGLGSAWGRQVATRMLKDAGFEQIDIQNLPHDVLNDYYVCRRQ